MRTCCIPHYHAATQEPEWTSLSLATALIVFHVILTEMPSVRRFPSFSHDL